MSIAVVLAPRKNAHSPTIGARVKIKKDLVERYSHLFAFVSGTITAKLSYCESVVWYTADMITEYGNDFTAHGAAYAKTPYNVTWERFLVPCFYNKEHLIEPSYDDELGAMANTCVTCKQYVVGEDPRGRDVPGVCFLEPLPTQRELVEGPMF